jgi:2-polyprenyl-6-methoxyphenol hydroxylase-like FAD-dependent oxidoreductase
VNESDAHGAAQGGDEGMKALVIGGGIGGLATALSLHAVGIDCEVYEQSRDIREAMATILPELK